MVTVESLLSARATGHKPEYGVLQSLIKVSGYLMVVYLVLKIIDLFYRGAAGLVFLGNLEGNMFLLEIIVGIIIPIIICFTPKLRKSKGGLAAFGILTVAGLVLNRMNVVFTGMSDYIGGSYFPSAIEWLVSIGLVAMGVLAYLFVVENFNIIPKEHHQAYEEQDAVRHSA